MESILPGGCYPTPWPNPPRCWPPYPPAPEPDPESLDATVDWLTYSHPELYQMVHSGLDLTGAMEVSAQWGRLGDELADIGAELGKVAQAAAAAWQGEAADLARDTLAALTNWAGDAGTLATKVSACVTIEVDNATNARDEMPSPPYHPTPSPYPHPDDKPIPVFTPYDGPTSAGALTGGEFTNASGLTSDMMVSFQREQALHEQAARTMERFQTASREVYTTVPAFSPPLPGRTLLTPEPRPEPKPDPRPQPTPPQHAPVGTPPPPPRTGVGPGGVPNPGGGSTQHRTNVGPVGVPGPGSGTGATEPTGRPAAASAGQSGGASGARPGVGGMPMGGMGGSRGGEDVERKTKQQLNEEEDIWGLEDGPIAPPVIGDGRYRA